MTIAEMIYQKHMEYMLKNYGFMWLETALKEKWQLAASEGY